LVKDKRKPLAVKLTAMEADFSMGGNPSHPVILGFLAQQFGFLCGVFTGQGQ
jgi:hypothetical protein